MRRFQIFLALLLVSISAMASSNLANVVCMVRFSDQSTDAWQHDAEFYDKLFNAGGEQDNSVFSYYRDMSFGALEWRATVVAGEYVDTYPRNYYRLKSAINTDGYETIAEGTRRFQTLVAAAAKYVEAILPPDAVVDARGNGVVDNFTLVIQGNSESMSSRILWPHNSEMTYVAGTLAGKRLKHYLAVFDGANGFKNLKPIPINTGVICHELMHTLDTPDLYSSGTLDPVCIWDLMSDNQTVPQGMLAYTRQSYGLGYGNWIPEIPQITQAGEYTVNVMSSPTADKVAYMVKPIRSNPEYFLIEYRSNKSFWDASLPGSGLIVSRINPQREGNGPRFFEVYVSRPGGSPDAAGKVNEAAISPDGRATFGYNSDTDFYPFYSDGAHAGFALTALSADDSQMTFRLDFDLSAIDDITADNRPRPYFNGSEVVAPGAVSIELYDLQGRSVSAHSIPSGLFLARITYADGTVSTSRFVNRP